MKSLNKYLKGLYEVAILATSQTYLFNLFNDFNALLKSP